MAHKIQTSVHADELENPVLFRRAGVTVQTKTDRLELSESAMRAFAPVDKDGHIRMGIDRRVSPPRRMLPLELSAPD
jgi:hypothetical protein